ncbi:MAG: HAD family hydrolase [Phycisphaerae bacterium]
MGPVEDVLSRTEVITFDCYGTLIDWSSGLRRSFDVVFGAGLEGRTDELVEAYVEIEAVVEAERYRPYREVMATTFKRLARRFSLELAPHMADVPAEILPSWEPFPDTHDALQRLKSKYRLGILSNIDGDLLEGTVRRLGVEFDFVVTAEDVRSYKPALGHFRRLLARYAARESVLHAGQSLFHDGVPAGELDIAYAWINRYNGVNGLGVKPVATYADLKCLADQACGV